MLRQIPTPLAGQLCNEIMRGLVEMLTFDALVGNNDRHPANWGVITPTGGETPPRFSPVFDTARALFWNMSEKKVRDVLNDQPRLESYIRRTFPQIGWNHCDRVGHFELVQKIYRGYPEYRSQVEKYAFAHMIGEVAEMIEQRFCQIMTVERRKVDRKMFRLPPTTFTDGGQGRHCTTVVRVGQYDAQILATSALGFVQEGLTAD